MTKPKGDSAEGPEPVSTSGGKTPEPPSTNVVSPPVWPKDGAPASPAGGGSGSQTWPPQKVVAGRYRVVRFLGRGGMGDVYEVEDLELQGRLALKTVRLDIAADPRLAERFKREIQIARKVTHPNICRIYDVGYDRVAPPEGSGEAPQEVRFLTMELLAGDPLSEHIAKKRRLTTGEALPIVEQMAAGLDAIHSLGIVHRDFKSGNVMLASSPDPRRGVRAVVTDFGLARPETTTESLASISETGRVVGTPAYMAPEQVQGKELTPAADIYALGIVMYEMVTGVRPFEGGSAITVAVKRLTEAPQPPRLHTPDLDPRWESVILRCLEREPGARFGSVLDVPKALRGEAIAPAASGAGSGWAGATQSVVVPSSTLRPFRPKQQGRILAGAILATIAAALAVGYYHYGSGTAGPATPSTQSASTLAAPMKPRRAVAVLGFKNVSARADAVWLSTAISEILTTDLAAGGKLRTIPGQEVARVKRELHLADEESLTKEGANQIRQNLAPDLIALGSYTVIGGAESPLLRVDLRLQDATSGEIVASGTATGTEAQLFDLVSRAGGTLREKLGLGSVSPAQAVEAEASLPSSRDAARFYSEGLAKLRLSDALAARDALEKAVAAEPKHPMPHAALAAAWSALGYDGKAREEAKTAAALSSRLPEQAKLSVEARFYEMNKEWGKAIETYRSLVTSFPDDLEYGLRLAEAQLSGGKPKEALVTVDALRKLPPPLGDDSRIALTQARAFQKLGDFKQQRVFAARAASKGTSTGARLLVARALLLEAAALDSLGESEKAMAANEDARALFEAAGDRGGVARAIERMAIALNRHGDPEGSKKLFERSLEIHREIGDKSSTARVLQNIGNVLLAQGSLSEAQRRYDESLSTFREIGAKYEAGVVLNDLGAKLQNAGDYAGAQKRYQEALSIFGEVGKRGSVAMTLTNLAELLSLRGDLKQAQRMHEESLAINREIGDKAGAAYDLFRLGEVFAAKGDLRVAKDKYEEALTIQSQLGDKAAAAQTRLGLATLAVAQARVTEGEALAREAEEVLRSEGATDMQALADVVLADALLAQGKVSEARKASDQARAASAKSQDQHVRVSTSLMAARVRAASKKPEDAAAALESIEKTRAECEKAGLLGHRYEAQLALGQIEVASGKAAAGRARLEALAKEAEAKGFGLIARKARGT